MEQLNDFFGKLFAYLREHPQYGLLVAILLVILYLIGLIFDWKWTLLPSGNSDFTQMWIDLFGRNAVRFVKGVLTVLLLLALVYLYYHYNNPPMYSSSTSHGYFDSVSTQLSLSVSSSFEGVASNSSANASEGVSASVSAVDTGMKAGMALAGAFDAGMERCTEKSYKRARTK